MSKPMNNVNIRTSGIRTLVSLIIIAAMAFSVLADTIRLKDGSLIKGEIVSFDGGRFIVVIGEGSRRRELTIDVSEVASIQFDRLPATSIPTSEKTGTIVPVSTKPEAKVVVKDPTVGQTVATETKRPAPVQTTPKTQPAATMVEPITLTVRVLADNTANGWTNSGWVVKKGQVIRITASGSISLGRGRSASPSGLFDLDDEQKLLKHVPTGALLAVIGDDNNDFIYIGAEREFTAARDGALYLGVNEGNLNDNSGHFEAKVEIRPGRTE